MLYGNYCYIFIENCHKNSLRACLLSASFSIFEKIENRTFRVVLNLITFGTYCKSPPNLIATNLFRDNT